MGPSPLPEKNLLRTVALAMELPFTLIVSVLLGGGIGYLLDRAIHTPPAFLLIGGLLGFGAGVWDIIRKLSKMDRDQGKSDGRG